MTFTLQACSYDALGANSPFIRSNCRACTVRSIAAGPLYHESKRLEMLTPAYTRALRANFGDDIAAAHAEVKAVAERIHNQRCEVL